MHTQVSRLRKLLEPDRRPRDEARVLRSTPLGYRIDVGTDVLDADLFASLTAAGRAALTADDPATAKARLTDALSLWRGPAYGDLADHPALTAAAARLEESRTTALEWLADARLALGEDSELVGTLERLVREHPFRERLWAQLMLALYRCGRQADALATYQRCRRRLVDELGIEPGPELQELDEAILLQKPELSVRAPKAAPTRQSAPVPRTTFVGREHEVVDVVEAFERHRLVTVTGPAGVGKTRLAMEVAQRVDGRFHHGVAFCDLVGVPGQEQVAAALADAVGVRDLAGSSEDPLAEHLATRELLLVIDNADHTLDAVADLTNRLLGRSPRLHVLVTSREPVRVVGERLIRLAPLNADAAAELFADRAALIVAGPLDPEAVSTLCRRVDGLPLAIELAASRLHSVPLADLVTRLDDRLSAIAMVSPPRGAGGHGRLREVVDWSVDLLKDEQRELLRRLAVFSGGCTAAAVAAVCELRADPVEALAELVDRSLVELDLDGGQGRYRLLETIRADGLDRLAELDEYDRYRACHLDWCLSLAPADLGHGEDPAEFERLGPETDNVVAALAWGLGGGAVSRAALLAVLAAPAWVHAGRLGPARDWLERAVAATPSESFEHRTALRWLGWTLGRGTDFAGARRALEAALVAAGAAGDDAAAADAETLLASIEIESGELTAGSARLERLSAAGSDSYLARRCHALGVRAQNLGELDQAAELLEKAASHARSARMWHTLVRTLTSLSQSESGRRHLARADGALQDALALARSHRLLGLMPRILGVQAIQTSRRGDLDAGRELFDEAVAAARRVGDLRVELITLTNLGVIDLRIDRPEAALHNLEQAFALAERTGDERNALLTGAALAEAVLLARQDVARTLSFAIQLLERSRTAGIRIATIAAIESAALALAERSGPGDQERALVLVGAAEAEQARLKLSEVLTGSQPTVRTIERLRAALGVAAVDAALRRGRETGLDEVVAELISREGAAR